MATPAITIKQPWAYAVAHGHKNVENRSKPPPKAVLNQRVAIHAGKAMDGDAQHFPPMARLLDSPECADAECVQGAVIGFAKVVGWWDAIRGVEVGPAGTRQRIESSPWFIGQVGILFEDATPIAEPIEARGQLGWWKFEEGLDAQ